MQILSSLFAGRHPRKIINVHHCFLRAFTGAKPYPAGSERGVKTTGTTSHHVTEDLDEGPNDEGPNIDQEVARISHGHQVPDVVQKGRDLERMVWSRAVRWRPNHRILFYANKMVVFD
jgi:formyltetrahydrofolate deformylase